MGSRTKIEPRKRIEMVSVLKMLKGEQITNVIG